MKRLALTLSLFLLAGNLLAQPTASVGLQWSPNTETDLKGYRLYRGTSPGQYDWFQDVGLVTTVRADGLQPGLTYYFTVTALNTGNLESEKSNEVSYTVPAGEPVTAIVGWEMTREPARVLMRWDAAPAAQGVGRWRVRYGLAGSADLTETWVTTPAFEFAAANAFVAYVVRIAAEGIQGVGPEKSFNIPGFPRVPKTVGIVDGSLVWTFGPTEIAP